MGVPESMTSDGGSEKLRDLLQRYGINHRLISAGFPRANSSAELAGKSAKRLLRDNVSPTGELNNEGTTVVPERLSPGQRIGPHRAD